MILEHLLERDVLWEPDNILNAALVNSLWLSVARPLLLQEVIISPGLSKTSAPDSRVQRLIDLINKGHHRAVKLVSVQFSRKRERSRKAAPGRGPEAEDVGRLFSLVPFVTTLRMSNILPTHLCEVLLEPLKGMNLVKVATVMLSTDVAFNPQSAYPSFAALCEIFSCWTQLRSLFLVRLSSQLLPDQPTPDAPALIPQLPHLHTLNLREFCLKDKELSELLLSMPKLKHLSRFRLPFP